MTQQDTRPTAKVPKSKLSNTK